jgi:sialate O-acetylesterase
MKKILLLMTLVAALSVRAEVHVVGIFGSNMVLQREMKVPVWGTAAPGEKISVCFAGQSVSTEASADGKWRVQLAPMTASAEPRDLTIAGANKIEFTNILIGDVWLCSGQSNMELTPEKGLRDPQTEIAAANWPQIRMVKLASTVAFQPVSDVRGNWAECAPDVMKNFSTAAYYFAREIYQQTKVPVGLIGCYYGGSNGQSWTRLGALAAEPELQALAVLPQGRGEASTNITASLTIGQPADRNSRYRSAAFYNGMIAPLATFAIRGVIWYQGEADTANAAQATRYAKLFSTMITDWRAQWGQGNFPFIFVQLPTSELQYPDPTDSAWARVRESQQKALALPGTAMVVTIDIGEGEVVHAHNKKELGQRLGQIALNKVYGQHVASAEAAFFKSAEFKDGRVIITFTNVVGGLVCTNAAGVKGFAIAGADRQFVWAGAKIIGDTVEVSSPQVATPVAVRYAWADNPVISLFNTNGLPVAPFRTDDWPAGKTSNPRAVP